MRRFVCVFAVLGAIVFAGCRHPASKPAAADESFSTVPGMEPPAPARPVTTAVPPKAARHEQPSASTPAPRHKMIVTPVNADWGKVVSVNKAGRFIVAGFALNHMPAMEETLSVYRQGLKVGEVKITGPQSDADVVADIVKGEAAIGDEVRPD
ncbi:MAG TPA: hypothetical protein VHH88_12505 [Verrucomicrobiae bacterium]|nr:hypothetical protein [Verrucomicrobiae bacterium]